MRGGGWPEHGYAAMTTGRAQRAGDPGKRDRGRRVLRAGRAAASRRSRSSTVTRTGTSAPARPCSTPGRSRRPTPWSIVGEGLRWTSQDWGSNVLHALGWRVGELGPSVLSIGFALLVVARAGAAVVGLQAPPPQRRLARPDRVAGRGAHRGRPDARRARPGRRPHVRRGGAGLPVGVRGRSALALAGRPAAAHVGVDEPACRLAARLPARRRRHGRRGRRPTARARHPAGLGGSRAPRRWHWPHRCR